MKGFWGLYFFLGFVTTVYKAFWGEQASRGLAYAIGQGLIWPAAWFPTLGNIIGGIIWLCVIAGLLLAYYARK